MGLEELINDHGVISISAALKAHGGGIRLVGGCVRDSIIGRDTTDIDLATDLVPEAVMQALRGANIKVIPTGIKHGTVTAVVRGIPYEITTLRRDVKCYGRHAEVVFTDSWMEDASRRDFTFNALYCDTDGKIYDYFSGIRDLKNREVAFIGDAEKRINEDFLRILRVFRFHAAICSGTTLSQSVTDLCKKYSHSISKLSKERIRNEFLKTISYTSCVDTLKAMKSCGVLQQVIQFPMHIGRLSNPHLQDRSPIARLSAMLKSETHSMEDAVEKVTDLLRLSNKEKKLLDTLLTMHLQLPLSLSERQKYLNILGPDTYHDLVVINFLQEGSLDQNLLLEHLDHSRKFSPMQLPIAGKDLTELGYREGEHLGRTLKTLREAWERDPYNITREDLLQKAKELLERRRDTAG